TTPRVVSALVTDDGIHDGQSTRTPARAGTRSMWVRQSWSRTSRASRSSGSGAGAPGKPSPGHRTGVAVTSCTVALARGDVQADRPEPTRVSRRSRPRWPAEMSSLASEDGGSDRDEMSKSSNQGITTRRYGG